MVQCNRIFIKRWIEQQKSIPKSDSLASVMSPTLYLEWAGLPGMGGAIKSIDRESQKTEDIYCSRR